MGIPSQADTLRSIAEQLSITRTKDGTTPSLYPSVLNRSARGFLNGVLGRVSDGIPDGVPDGVLDEAPDEIPDEAPDEEFNQFAGGSASVSRPLSVISHSDFFIWFFG